LRVPRAAILLVVISGLYGAIGVAAAAGAAHLGGDPRLGTASQFLMIHAAAILGAVGAAGALGIGGWILGPAAAIALGTLLFCGDLLVRATLGASPLPMSAPIGGSLLIAGWIALSAGSAIGFWLRRRRG
jgi:uncharacterized membrane protein YgdD (TMEM256/DUF423 family)